MLTTQPSTTRNLAALAGDGRAAIAYGKDIVDLLRDEDTLTVEEGDLAAAAVAVMLTVAAREVERTGAMVALDSASHSAALSIAALRGWTIADTLDRVLLAERLRDAMIFQLTDLDEQD